MKSWMKLLFIIFTFIICGFTDVSYAADNLITEHNNQPVISVIDGYDKNTSLELPLSAEKFLISPTSRQANISVYSKNERNNLYSDGFFAFRATEKGKILDYINNTATLDRTENGFITFVSEHNTRAP